MAQYRKKPVVIEAIQYTGINPRRQSEYDAFVGKPVEVRSVEGWLHLVIDTLEGTMLASPNDFLIRGVAGEIYPCKPDIFAATYEAVA